MAYPIEQEILDQIDVSELTASQRVEFTNWLQDQSHLTNRLKNALQRGQRIKAGLMSFHRREQYLVRILD